MTDASDEAYRWMLQVVGLLQPLSTSMLNLGVLWLSGPPPPHELAPTTCLDSVGMGAAMLAPAD